MSQTEDIEPDLDCVEYFKVPRDFYPEIWSDPIRMNVLIAPFRAKSLNAINYESKLNFWRNLIVKYCDAKGSTNVTVEELRCAFKWQNKKPYGLETVFAEMKQSRHIQMLNEFLKKPPETWSGWALQTASESFFWGYGKMKEHLFAKTQSMSDFQFIVLDVVKKQAEKLQEKFSNGQVMSMDEFNKNIIGTGLTADGARYALHFLIVNQRAAIEILNDNQNTTIIQIAQPNTHLKSISETERAVYSVTKAEKMLLNTVEQLEMDINKTTDKARQLVRENKKELARNHLKRKHNLQRQLDQKSNTLDQIQLLLNEIRNTTQNELIVGAFRIGSAALQTILSDFGMTVDGVDDLMSDVKETIEANDEIQTALGSQINSSASEEDLEDELNELVHSEQNSAKLDQSIERRLRELNISGGNILDSLNSLPVSPPPQRSEAAI